MLQAILHKKASLNTKTDNQPEDALTSSIVGLLQYLPDEVFWQILYEASERRLPKFSEAGAIENISFWKSMRFLEFDRQSVEPDVWIKLEKMHLIIEAKRYDGGGQYNAQWDLEIKALLKHLEEEEDQPIDEQKIYLLALGGNTQTSELQLKVEGKEYPIVRMHWQTLLEEVKKYTYESSSCSDAEKRICKDIIKAFEHFEFFALKWLDSLAGKYKDTPARLAPTSIDTLFHLPNYK
ncbi:hypothetical protein [uncultured Porphyromonas sp.]|uniref:hypothetical protein n=1 Tax=uncultured Porphyromonas sp. TaxID=159274 RepID=UPI00262E9E85|nr:hypothetical protein [uncultured Porphyromonas sp.]